MCGCITGNVYQLDAPGPGYVNLRRAWPVMGASDYAPRIIDTSRYLTEAGQPDRLVQVGTQITGPDTTFAVATTWTNDQVLMRVRGGTPSGTYVISSLLAFASGERLQVDTEQTIRPLSSSPPLPVPPTGATLNGIPLTVGGVALLIG